jgi:DNA-binding NarL/FixJ family response regulator
LTSLEREIIEWIWAGLKNREIGERLKISVTLVEAHRENIMKKDARVEYGTTVEERHSG